MRHDTEKPTAPRPPRVVLVIGSGEPGLTRARALVAQLPALDVPVLVAVTGHEADALVPALAGSAPRVAHHDDDVTAGLWLCPAGSHTVVRDGRFVVTDADDTSLAPSIDKLLFQSRAEFRSRVTVVVCSDDFEDSPCLRLVALRGGTVHHLGTEDDLTDERARREVIAQLTDAHSSIHEAVSA